MLLLLLLFRGPPFITYLDNLPKVVREDNGIFRMPIADKYKVWLDMPLQLSRVDVMLLVPFQGITVCRLLTRNKEKIFTFKFKCDVCVCMCTFVLAFWCHATCKHLYIVYVSYIADLGSHW